MGSNIAAISFGFYMHGLTFYFLLSSLAGAHSGTLTAIYQLLTISITFCLNLFDSEARGKLFKFGLLEILYLTFIFAFLADYRISPIKETFPENLFIYFCVYWFALIVGRSLTFSQLKLVCYTTSCIAALTCFLLLAQVATGTASWADHGRRLVAGVTGNPIIVGYTGTYAFLSCLVLWMVAKPAVKGIWLGLCVPGLLICVFSGTRSATLSLFLSAALILIYYTRIVSQSGRSAVKVLTNLLLTAGLALSLMLVAEPLMAPPSTASMTQEASPMQKAIDNGMTRIDALFRVVSGQNSNDGSIEGRRGMYEFATRNFLENPVFGNGLNSMDAAHNAFLQVTTEFGILGIITFVLPFLYVMYRVLEAVLQTAAKVRRVAHRINPERFIRSDFSMVTCFAIVIFVQAVCLFSFHGDPYRNYLPLCSTGLLLAYLRLDKSIFTKSL